VFSYFRSSYCLFLHGSVRLLFINSNLAYTAGLPPAESLCYSYRAKEAKEL